MSRLMINHGFHIYRPVKPIPDASTGEPVDQPDKKIKFSKGQVITVGEECTQAEADDFVAKELASLTTEKPTE